MTKLARIRRNPVLTVAQALEARGRDTLALRRWHKRNADNFARSLHDMEEFEAGRLPILGQLHLSHNHADGTVTDYGLISTRVVTNAFVAYIVDAMQGLQNIGTLRFHGLGTGSTAESASQTALATELTTQYASANTRPQGTLGEASGSSNTFETTATVTVSAAVAIREHGVFSSASAGTGTLLDRSVFAEVNLAASESLTATYQLTFPAGG